MAMVKVCETSDVSAGNLKGCEVNGKKIFVTKVEGNYYCCDSVCTHQQGPLEQGDLDGTCVTCPWHGAQFDVTSGNFLGGPPGTAPINKYKVEEREDGVYADVGVETETESISE